MNIHYLIQLLVLVEECRKPEAVIDELGHVIASYGFSYYGILRYPKQAEDPVGLMLAGQWPDMWPQIYLSKKYLLSDPTVRYLAYAQTPFRWKDSLAAFRKDAHYRRMEQMMADAGSHGLKDGYTFPIYGRNGILGYMTVGGRPVDLSPVEISLFDAIARARAGSGAPRAPALRRTGDGWRFRSVRRCLRAAGVGRSLPAAEFELH